jgi:hypothetical protein
MARRSLGKGERVAHGDAVSAEHAGVGRAILAEVEQHPHKDHQATDGQKSGECE